ncbi:biopolymer transporter ExbD [Caulobacter sp.]|uniref:ExbD/TolR family protein n=1 Tax=Caulobacter sp. TaxID=78 RepID=UPI001B0F3C39|nr:biopolymer transporter ExbD [Caulobacter sp.]MBO9544293.1 biopolymer transporter ExbD [Caulobacter sp.]
MKRGVKITIGVLLALGLLALCAVPMKVVTIKIDLPPPIPAKPARTTPVFITIKPDGALAIEDAPTTLEALPGDLSTRFGPGPKDQQRIMIRATGDVPYERFMTLLNALQEHGWYKVGLINENLSTEAQP